MPARKLAERAPLTRDRILATAMRLADADGIDALTMRRLADELGVEAMSIYYHLPNKDAILDGLVEDCFAEIEAAVGGFDTAAAPGTWKSVLRERILAARRVMLRHRWVPAVLETRASLGPTMIRYVDGAARVMRAGGLSFDLVHHALHALGSRMYGFVQELGVDDSPSDPSSPADEDETAAMLRLAPTLAAMLEHVVHDDPDSTLGWCDDQTEFEFGLDLVLDGLERQADSQR